MHLRFNNLFKKTLIVSPIIEKKITRENAGVYHGKLLKKLFQPNMFNPGQLPTTFEKRMSRGP